MKQVIAYDGRGYIDAADHRRAVNGEGTLASEGVVRFYFGQNSWMDVKFDKSSIGEPCLQVRAMSAIPSLSVQPSSGNTIYLVPGK